MIIFQLNDDDILYPQEKIQPFCRINPVIVALQCIWWIASCIRFQQGVIIYIQIVQLCATPVNSDNREIPTTPMHIHWHLVNFYHILLDPAQEGSDVDIQVLEQVRKEYLNDSLRCTLKGRVNLSPYKNNQLWMAWKHQQLVEVRNQAGGKKF
jgi:hypothetical protein